MSQKVFTQNFELVKSQNIFGKYRIVKSIYDHETKTIFGRRGIDWGKLLLFYFIFYFSLATLFGICMITFLQHFVNPRIPSLQLDYSLIGTSPGLGFRPLPPDVRSTFISFKGTKNESYGYWKVQLSDFLKVYKEKGRLEGAGQNIATCSFDNMPKHGQVCDVNIKDFGDCSEENEFMYHRSSPCIFLKLNRIFGWTPIPYDINELPSDMPKLLQDQIKTLSHNTTYAVWLSCRGETPTDEENIGPIKYYPFPGFPAYYFPYRNSEGYLSPLVAVHFQSPNTGILINVECRAWAKNIKYDKKERIGSIHFELMVE